MSVSSQSPSNAYTSNPRVTFDHLIDGAERALTTQDIDLPFGQAISWLTKAEEVGIELGEVHLRVVADAYINLILVAVTKSQTLLLNCGNILRQHRDLAIATEAALRRLTGLRRQFNMAAMLPSELLDAQGHAELLVKRVSRYIEIGVMFTDDAQFDSTMSDLEHLRSLVLPLTKKVASDYRTDKETLNLIRTAALNASYSINRFFKFLSDYKKAAKMCYWAERLLRDIDNRAEFVLNRIDRMSLSRRLRFAQDSLTNENFGDSKSHLQRAEKLLRRINADF